MSLDLKLFYKINNLVGRYKWLDIFGYLGGEWVIWFMVIAFAGLAYWKFRHSLPTLGGLYLKAVLIWFVAWLINLTIAFFVRRQRPHVAHPDSNLLIQPIANWHSFPSDHTMTSFLIAFLAINFGLPGSWLFILGALWVSLGRIFIGVHYPTDLLGGLGVATLVFWLAKFFKKI